MATLESVVSLKGSLRSRGRRAVTADSLFRWVTGGLASVILLLVVAMVAMMANAALPSLLHFGPAFLWTSDWDPVHQSFGALPFIYGTVVSSALALCLAVPLGIGVAVFLAELAPVWLRAPASTLVELLAAIPSVVYGLWGIFVLADWLRGTVEPALKAALGFLPFFQGPSFGIGMLAAALILTIMVLPTIAAVSRDVILAVPAAHREAMLALGSTRWEAIWQVVLPTARTGIIGACVLALGRALGETMAVTMVIGNRPEISASLFAPSYTMASVLANEFSEATYELYLAALIEIGLLLFGVTFLMNAIARLLVWRVTRHAAPLQ